MTAEWPDKLTPELREVLGLMCFQLAPYAHIYRQAGEFVDADGNQLKSRAEDEQAFMLHKLVGFALQDAVDWRTILQTDLDRVKAGLVEP